MELPKIRTRVLTEKVTVPIEPDLRRALQELKDAHSLDTMEICRQAIRQAVVDVREALKKAS